MKFIFTCKPFEKEGVVYKKCTYCAEDFLYSSYYKGQGRCKKCFSVKCNDWVKKNREKAKASKRKHARKAYKENPEKFKARRREYRSKNREKILERQREAWTKKHGRVTLYFPFDEGNLTFKICCKCLEKRDISLFEFRLSRKIWYQVRFCKICHSKSDSIRNKKNVANLEDTYIRDLLSNQTELQRKDVPQELIELQRLKLKIKREIKNVKNIDNG